jgi:1-phosphatidylinositol-4-phosphate 5-kinase
MSEVYYLGIIDIMQPYNWRKQVESSLKGFLDNPEEISCIEPSKYAKRFLGM